MDLPKPPTAFRECAKVLCDAMAIFDEPSREPLPQPTVEDVAHAGGKGLLSVIPIVGGVASELLGLLSSPVVQRRDDWFADLERRLRELEGRVDGFRFDDLAQNEQFVSATLQATQVALRTHQPEKREALRNAVLNISLGKAPVDDRQSVFLNLIDRFTPLHLRVLRFLKNDAPKPDSPNDVSNHVVLDLNNNGLLHDGRPFTARNRDYPDLLSSGQWTVNSLGAEFLAFVKEPL